MSSKEFRPVELLELPVATLLLILRHLDVQSNGRMARTCRTLRNLVGSDVVWEDMLRMWNLKLLESFPPLPGFDRAASCKAKVRYLQDRRNRFMPFSRRLMDAVDRVTRQKFIVFPQAKQLSEGRVETGFRISHGYNMQASTLSILSTVTIRSPPEMVFRMLEDLSNMPKWNRILCSFNKMAFVSNEIGIYDIVFPVGRFVHTIVKDTSGGFDLFRMSWTMEVPDGLVDENGEQIVGGHVAESAKAASPAGAPPVSFVRRLDENVRGPAAASIAKLTSELPEPAGGPLETPDNWVGLPSGYVATRVDDYCTKVVYLNQLDARTQLNAHFVFRMCGIRTQVLDSLRQYCEQRLPAEEQAIDVLCNWHRDLREVRNAEPPVVLPPLRAVLDPESPVARVGAGVAGTRRRTSTPEPIVADAAVSPKRLKSSHS